jgi:hypothetical protein
LLVAPPPDSCEALLALPPPEAFVLKQSLESACECIDVSSLGRVAVHSVANEISHTTYLAGDYDGKAGAHGLIGTTSA